jgi:hypothetical protein
MKIAKQKVLFMQAAPCSCCKAMPIVFSDFEEAYLKAARSSAAFDATGARTKTIV